MTITKTTAAAVRETLVNKIKRIRPRYTAHKDNRWRWVGDRTRTKVTRGMRNFQVIMEPETETPSGAYGGGIEYQARTIIRVSYPLVQEEMTRHAGADQQDLTSILVRLHYDLDGMFPVQVQGREEQLLSVSMHKDEEGAYVVDFTVLPGLHFFADDQVELYPE